MLFKALAALTGPNRVVSLSFAALDSDRYRLTITSVHTGKEKEPQEAKTSILDEPLVVTGTLDELEVDLPGKITEMSALRSTVRQEFSSMEAEIEKKRKELEQITKDMDKQIAEQKKRAAEGIPVIQAPPRTPQPTKPIALL